MCEQGDKARMGVGVGVQLKDTALVQDAEGLGFDFQHGKVQVSTEYVFSESVGW